MTPEQISEAFAALKVYRVTFTAGSERKSFDMLATRKQARDWAAREILYFNPGAPVGRFTVRLAPPAVRAAWAEGRF